MISDEKLVYDDRSSLSDDDDSDGSSPSNVCKKPMKKNLDDEDKKSFTCLPICYAMIVPFNSKDAVGSNCPIASHNKCWQEKKYLESILDGYECKNRSFKAD